MSSFRVYLFNFKIYFAKIVSQLIFSSLNIWVNLFYFWWNIRICLFQFGKRMICHFSTHMTAINFAKNTQSLTANTTIQLKFIGWMCFTWPKFFRFITDTDSLMFISDFWCMVIQITLKTKMSILCYTIKFGLLWRYFATVLT